MFARAGKLIVKKGMMKFNDFYSCFRQYNKMYPTETFVLHFRIATHGQKNKENTHPFFIHDTLAYAHNGILSGLAEVKGNLSDSAVFAGIMKDFPKDFYTRPEFVQILNYVASGNSSKFVFLDNEGQHLIINEKSGYWSHGCWYSCMVWSDADNEEWDFYSQHHSTTTGLLYRGEKNLDAINGEKRFDYKDWCEQEKYKECDICGDLKDRAELTEIRGTHLTLNYCPDCMEEAEKYSCYSG